MQVIKVTNDKTYLLAVDSDEYLVVDSDSVVGAVEVGDIVRPIYDKSNHDNVMYIKQ